MIIEDGIKRMSELGMTLETAEKAVASMFPVAKPWLTKARLAVEYLEKLEGEVKAVSTLARAKGDTEIADRLDAALKGQFKSAVKK